MIVLGSGCTQAVANLFPSNLFALGMLTGCSAEILTWWLSNAPMIARGMKVGTLGTLLLEWC